MIEQELGLSRIQENLLIIFFLLPFMLATWWFFTRFAFRSIKKYVSMRERLRMIYVDPLSASIHTSTIILSIALLVIAAYGRIV